MPRAILVVLSGLILALLFVSVSCKTAVKPPQGPVEKSDLRVPPGFKAKEGTKAEPYSKTGWAKEIVHETIEIEMVFIPAGRFLMGSPVNEGNWWANDEAQHEVTLSKPFYMGKYEVTQGEWQKVMGSNPSNFKSSDLLPVDSVSWNDCQEFLRKAGGGLRLPTEAQWEYACRAGTRTPFNTGETISTDEANFNGNYVYGNGQRGVYRYKTLEAGSFAPNAWGLYDMHGNVCEWCADWYGEYPRDVATDPTGAGSGQDRVLRGGCWCGPPQYCRSASRIWSNPVARDDLNGFRVVVSLASVDLK